MQCFQRQLTHLHEKDGDDSGFRTNYDLERAEKHPNKTLIMINAEPDY